MKNKLFFFLLTFVSICQGQKSNLPLKELLQLKGNPPLICSHRGGYYPELPENSLSLFDKVYFEMSGAPVMIEIDIREDKNGMLWVLHDESMDRTTNGTGKISDLSSAEVSQFLLKDQNGNPTAEKIPSLNDVIRYIKDKNVYLMLDIKGNLYDKVISVFKNAGLDARCIMLTFNIKNTQEALNKKSAALISALVTNESDWMAVRKLNIPAGRIAAYVTDNTPAELIKNIKSEGVITLSDPRELWNKKNTPLSFSAYQSMVKNLCLNILVTDFPVEVSNWFKKEKSIHALHLKKFQWFIQQQTDSLELLLHDEIQYIHSNGWKESKQELIRNIQSGKMKYSDIQTEEAEVKLFDNIAIVSGKGTFTVSLDDKPIVIHLLYTEVYQENKANKIQLISRHACRL